MSNQFRAKESSDWPNYGLVRECVGLLKMSMPMSDG